MRINKDSNCHANINFNSNSWIDIAYRQTDSLSPTMDFHYHDGFEIFQIWSEGGNVLVGDKIYPIHSGYIYIVNAQELHRTNPSSSNLYIRNKINFSPSYIHDILEITGQMYLMELFMNRDSHFSHNIIPDLSMSLKIDHLFSEMSNENCTKSTGWSGVIISHLIEMLVILYRWYSSNKNFLPFVSSVTCSNIENVINFINHHYSEDINIESISNTLHLNKYYLCHSFKAITGITIMQHLLEKRIFEVKKLLLLSDMPLSSIAVETGFNSFSSFGRAFKRITNLAPIQYRKKFKTL